MLAGAATNCSKLVAASVSSALQGPAGLPPLVAGRDDAILFSQPEDGKHNQVQHKQSISNTRSSVGSNSSRSTAAIEMAP
mmetsp:Transcript_26294/g.51842  ORF Transcript_26294/g.51842 Transcript_26294/m.51842 type:complete len:80 (-) Transcript_26294:18-257(-)